MIEAGFVEVGPAVVAAFSQVSNELLALGAPPSLVEHAHSDAIDEVRHARRCYGIAAAIEGESVGPAPFPAATLPPDLSRTYVRMAAETTIEACVLERAASLVAQRLTTTVHRYPAILALLEQIAVDESRHADHGWAVVQWCIAQEGVSAHAAARRALDRFEPASVPSPVPHDRYECWGLAGPTCWGDCLARAWQDADERLRAVARSGVPGRAVEQVSRRASPRRRCDAVSACPPAASG